MENWQIIVLSIYGPFLGWLALSNIQQGKKIVALQTMNANVAYKMDSLQKAVDSLSVKMDLFMKSELDTMKEIAKSVKQ